MFAKCPNYYYGIGSSRQCIVRNRLRLNWCKYGHTASYMWTWNCVQITYILKWDTLIGTELLFSSGSITFSKCSATEFNTELTAYSV